MSLLDSHWLPSHRADPRALALYLRHYSAGKNAPYRNGKSRNFVGPGEPMVLLTAPCDALFVWVRNTVERFDRQQGVICTVFRNEGSVRSSALIEEACELAWQRWTGQRLWTYVASDKIKSSNPGYCFQMAGFRKCGTSQRGLVILERLP